MVMIISIQILIGSRVSVEVFLSKLCVNNFVIKTPAALIGGFTDTVRNGIRESTCFFMQKPQN